MFSIFYLLPHEAAQCNSHLKFLSFLKSFCYDYYDYIHTDREINDELKWKKYTGDVELHFTFDKKRINNLNKYLTSSNR